MSAILVNNGQTIRAKQSAGADEYLTFDDTVAVRPANVPLSATWAMINFEAAATATDPYRSMRYREDGTAATAAVGVIVGDNESREVFTRVNISNLSFIGIVTGETHTVAIQYFR